MKSQRKVNIVFKRSKVQINDEQKREPDPKSHRYKGNFSPNISNFGSGLKHLQWAGSAMSLKNLVYTCCARPQEINLKEIFLMSYVECNSRVQGHAHYYTSQNAGSVALSGHQ